jgi:two-component system nitrate/nitrite sensor histidine kinase NarX
MEKDILRIRWISFFAFMAIGSIYLFPQIIGNKIALVSSILLIVSTAGLLTWGLGATLRYLVRRNAMPADVSPAKREAPVILEVVQGLFVAQTSQEIIEILMRAGRTITSAEGASFVSFDEWGSFMPRIIQGVVPESTLQAWTGRLVDPETRQLCRNCQTRTAGRECVLLRDTLPTSSLVFCQPVRDGGREIGVVNYFFRLGASIDEYQRVLLDDLSEISSTAINTLRRRDREIAVLRHLQSSNNSQELPELLTGLAENLREALDVKSALLWIPDGLQGGLSTPALLPVSFKSDCTDNELLHLPSIRGIWQTVQASRQTISMQNISLGEKKIWRHLLAVPLAWRDEEPVGLLLLGDDRPIELNERRLLLIQNVAGQASLLIQNGRLMVQIEYQAVVDERTRLAREIHDGLAQTLAFLKIQSAQMQAYLQQGKLDKLESILLASHRTLSEAYQDARQAIDNLRSVPESSVQEWITRVAVDFQQAAGIPVDTSALDLKYDLSPTVQAQLIRIVQEALGNIRKHANASQVIIRGNVNNGEALLEVCDNGIGFEPGQISMAARYGLVGMRERADLIGAEFQIVSKPGNGTIIRLCLPIQARQESL